MRYFLARATLGVLWGTLLWAFIGNGEHGYGLWGFFCALACVAVFANACLFRRMIANANGLPSILWRSVLLYVVGAAIFGLCFWILILFHDSSDGAPVGVHLYVLVGTMLGAGFMALVFSGFGIPLAVISVFVLKRAATPKTEAGLDRR